MALDLEAIEGLTTTPDDKAWATIIERVMSICGAPLDAEKAPGEVTRRDRAIGEIDHFLSSAAWGCGRPLGTPPRGMLTRSLNGGPRLIAPKPS
ncbi:hypothetical protein FLP41_14070 [Paracoccus marcusii]|uniref:hypothetical protein n=1 Tax=Paracoccus marcusii TaxID=59779 RepID=UPI002ED52307|nr:hypothetical protein FLP41_14070 [Paracoccus marcusii]